MASKSPEKPSERESVPELSWEEHAPRTPENRFRIYRLCDCDACEGTGRTDEYDERGLRIRCPVCRGEGKQRELVATAPTPEAAGLAIVTLGREGEFEDCPLGLLDTMGEVGQKWIIRPWQASPRNVSDAGRVLGKAAHR